MSAKKKNRRTKKSDLPFIVRLTQPGGRKASRAEGLSLSDESLRLRWIRQTIQDIMMDVWSGPFPKGKFGFHKWVKRHVELADAYSKLLDKGHTNYKTGARLDAGRKSWVDFVLGEEKAKQFREELAWLKEEYDHSQADPKVVSLWEMVKYLKLVQEYQDYTPDYEKYWAILSQKDADLREEETWHRADDGTMDEDRPLPGIQIPYRWGKDNKPEQFTFRTIRMQKTGMQVWVPVVRSERKEKMLGIYYRKGDGPAIPYWCLGHSAEALYSRGDLKGARKLYDTYMAFKIAMNQRSAEISTALCGKVHVHWMQVGDLCVWSPIVKADRVVKQMPKGIPDEFYRD